MKKKENNNIILEKDLKVRLLKAIQAGEFIVEEFPNLITIENCIYEALKKNGLLPEEQMKIKRTLSIDKSLKIRLLQSIQASEINPDLFPEFRIQGISFFDMMKEAFQEEENEYSVYIINS